MPFMASQYKLTLSKQSFLLISQMALWHTPLLLVLLKVSKFEFCVQKMHMYLYF